MTFITFIAFHTLLSLYLRTTKVVPIKEGIFGILFLVRSFKKITSACFLVNHLAWLSALYIITSESTDQFSTNQLLFKNIAGKCPSFAEVNTEL